MLKRMPLHALLFCISPVIYLFSISIEQIQLFDIVLPLMISVGIGAFLFFGIYTLTKNLNKASVETSLVMFLFSTFGHVLHLSLKFGNINNAVKPIVGTYIVLFIAGTWMVFRVIRDFQQIIEFLNVFSIILVLISVFNISNVLLKTQHQLPSPPINTSAASATNMPDIYYIILDGYGGYEMLSTIYNFDNQEFINSLEEKGFYIAKESRSNYPRTFLSLSSTLNLEYISNDSWIGDHLTNNASIFYDLINDNLVKNQLAHFGYQTYIFPNLLNTTQWKDAEIVGRIPIGTPFLWEYMQTTGLVLLWNSLPYEIYQLQTLNSLDLLEESFEIVGPKFVFYHILLPHPPFIFGSDGNLAYSSQPFSYFDGNDLNLPPETYHTGYVQQLQFINAKIDKIIDTILTNSSSSPIIIIQGDHGPGSYLDFHSYEGNDCLYERYSIFNAYYFPDHNYKQLYPEISPVNSFRIIFNQYFGLSYNLLDDRSYYSTNEDIVNFIEVTNQLTQQYCEPLLEPTN